MWQNIDYSTTDIYYHVNKNVSFLRKENLFLKLKKQESLCEHVFLGELYDLKKIHSHGVDIFQGNYDNTTGLHVAAAEGTNKNFFFSKSQ